MYEWFKQNFDHAISENTSNLYASRLVNNSITNIERLTKAFEKKSPLLRVFSEMDYEDFENFLFKVRH